MMMMKTKTALFAAASLIVLLSPAVLLADHDEDEEHHRERRGRHEEHARRRSGSERVDRAGDGEAKRAALQASPAFAEYREECGSCHLAYPPGLLPARSWAKLLGGLDAHFGQNAELAPDVRARLGSWLEENAAESGSHPLSRRVVRSAGESAPLRISELAFIRHEHDEVAPEVWSRPAVKTVANCGACHGGAERWSFDEHGVRIPR